MAPSGSSGSMPRSRTFSRLRTTRAMIRKLVTATPTVSFRALTTASTRNRERLWVEFKSVSDLKTNDNEKEHILHSLAVCLLIAFSCSESVLEKENRNRQTTETYYKTQSEVGSAVIGIYGVLQSNSLGGREWFFLHDL